MMQPGELEKKDKKISLKIKNLKFKFKGKDILFNGLSCEFNLNGIVGIVGKSGVGKSTLLYLLSGIYGKDDQFIDEFSGEILLNGMTPENLKGPRDISFMHQNTVLLDHFNLIENILLAEHDIIKSDGGRCESLLEKLNLSLEKELRPSQLSGGMETRVSLARSLIFNPKFLFLDEPFNSLDIDTKWKIYRFIREERKCAEGLTFLTSHDIIEILMLSDNLLIMKKKNGAIDIELVANLPPVLLEDRNNYTKVLKEIKLEEVLGKIFNNKP